MPRPCTRRWVGWAIALGVALGPTGATGAAIPTPAVRGALDAERPTLVLCFEDADIPPWRHRDRTGHNFTLLDRVAERTGVRFVYRPMPWRRCQSSLAQNEVDGAFALSHTPERQHIGVYPPGHAPDHPAGNVHRMFSDGYVLLRRRGDAVRFEGGRIVDLQGPIGAQAGYSIIDDVRRMGYAVDDGARDPWAVLRKLVEGRIGAATLGANKARELQASGRVMFTRLEVLDPPLVQKDYFLVLSSALVARDPALAAAIWAAIASIRETVPPTNAATPRPDANG